MAHNRFIAGDAYMSLKFFNLAQQVQPPSATFDSINH
jgi:hypothetical protein